jgi:hypothetical protein
MASGTTKDPLYNRAVESYLLVQNKQDSTRICIRKVGSGVAEAGRLYMVDGDFAMLARHQERLWPGSKPIVKIGDVPVRARKGQGANGEATGKGSRGKRGNGPELLHQLLETTEKDVLTGKEIQEATGIGSDKIGQAMGHKLVAVSMERKGWRKATRKDVGLTGKGWVLTTRAA